MRVRFARLILTCAVLAVPAVVHAQPAQPQPQPQPEAPATGTLNVIVEGAPGARVVLDGQTIAPGRIAVPAGEHLVQAAADGFKGVDEKVTVAAGETKDVRLVLERGDSTPPPTPQPAPRVIRTAPEGEADPVESSPWRTVGGAMAVVGGIGLLGGVVTGLLAIVEQDTLLGSCRGGPCTTDVDATRSRVDALATASTISLIGGAALTAGGVVVMIVARDKPAGRPTSATLRFSTSF